MQNINFSKKRFNFEIFRSQIKTRVGLKKKFSPNNIEEEEEESLDKKLNKFKQSTQLLGMNENIFKNINLNFHLQGDMEVLTKQEQYREIIKLKQKNENKFRTEYLSFNIGLLNWDKVYSRRKMKRKNC